MAVQQFKLPKSIPSSRLRIDNFRGINLSVTPTQIDDNQASDMLNCNIDERGALNKRTGFERVYTTSLGVGRINGTYLFRKQDNTRYFLIAHGTTLYTQTGSNQPVSIYSGLADNDVEFFTMGDKCYIMDGTNYLFYDGTTVSNVTPYIPTITIADGSVATGYTSYEDWNLLGRGFRETRSGDGTTTTFQMSQKDLDADEVSAIVDGATLTENTDFTVDRVNGTITFNASSLTGTNNIEWTAYKTYAGYADKIKQSSLPVIYGGAQDTRVFVANGQYVYTSGLLDPTYWPENRFYKFSDIVKGFSKQYDTLVVHKLNGLHMIAYTLTDGVASFPSKPINDEVGTIASKSIQLINNSPMSLSKDGVYALVSSQIRDERNVQHISAYIDPKLLEEVNLEDAISIDYDKKYWLALNGKVYLYDYRIGEWFIYDNIHASSFIEIDDDLYFASSQEGLMYRFKKKDSVSPYNDDGSAITAYWYSKYFDFNAPSMLKLIEKIFIGMKPFTHTSVDVYTRTNKTDLTLIYSQRVDQFDFNDFDFNRFTFLTSDFPQEGSKKTKIKKITNLQIQLKNDTLDESLGVLNIEFKYSLQSEVK